MKETLINGYKFVKKLGKRTCFPSFKDIFWPDGCRWLRSSPVNHRLVFSARIIKFCPVNPLLEDIIHDPAKAF